MDPIKTTLHSLANVKDIDVEPTDAETAAVKALIAAEINRSTPTSLHPGVSPAPDKSRYLSAETNSYIKSAGSGTKTPGIDLARYTSLDRDNGSLNLKRAYQALAHAHGRLEDLTLLSEYGKHAWLMSNDLLERDLRQLELAVERERAAVDAVHDRRRGQQAEAKATFEYLEKRWREGVRNAVEVGVACAELEEQVKSRHQAS